MRWLRGLAAAAAAIALAVAGLAVYVATLDLNAYKGRIQAALSGVVGRSVEIVGPLHLAWSLTPSVAASDVRVANAEWGSTPEMATVESMTVGFGLAALLGGRVEVDRLTVSKVRLLLERGPDGRGNWTDLGPPAGDGGGETPVGSVRLTAATVVWKSGPAAAERLYRIDELQFDGAGANAARIKLAGDLSGDALDLAGTVPALPALLRAGAAGPIDLRGTLGGAAVALAGDLTLAHGRDGLERIAVAGLRSAYDGIEATGSAEIDLSGRGTRLTADLAAAVVDLGRYLGGARADNDPLGRRLPLDLLPAVDGRADIAIGRLLAGGWVAEDITATAMLERGLLTLDPVKGRIAGGSVAGRGTIDTARSPAALTLRSTGEGLDMAQIYRALTDQGLVEGRGHAAVDLKALGDTPRALLASLDGDARLVVRDGVILNKYWELIAADLASEFIPFARTDDRGRLNCMVGRFDIRRGRADATVLMVDSDRVLVGGAGHVRLLDQRLDLRLVPQPKDPSLVSLATPILLGGTLQDPTVTPDPVGVARGLGAIAAGAMIAPLAVLLPFVSTGNAEQPCPAAIAMAETGRRPPARAPSRPEPDKPGGIRGLFEGLRKAIE